MRVIWNILSRQPYPVTASAISHRIGEDWITEEDVEAWLNLWEREKRVQRHGENIQGQMLFSIVKGAGCPC